MLMVSCSCSFSSSLVSETIQTYIFIASVAFTMQPFTRQANALLASLFLVSIKKFQKMRWFNFEQAYKRQTFQIIRLTVSRQVIVLLSIYQTINKQRQ